MRARARPDAPESAARHPERAHGALWNNEALRIEADRINDGGYTHAWDTGSTYYLESGCEYVDGRVSQLTLLGQGDESYVYLHPDGQNVVHIQKRFDEGRSLAERQQLAIGLQSFGWPIEVFDVPSRATCARAEQYERNSNEVGDQEEDDAIDDSPSGPGCLPQVIQDDDGYDPALDDSPTFDEVLMGLEGEASCRALRSLGKMYRALDKPLLSTADDSLNGSGLWDFQVGIYSDSTIRAVDPRRAFVGQVAGQPWEGTPGLITSYPLSDGDAITLEMARDETRRTLDNWWEILGGDAAYAACGHCERLEDLAPINWSEDGVPVRTTDSHVDPQATRPSQAALTGLPVSGTVLAQPAYLASYIEALALVDDDEVTLLEHRGVAWVRAGEDGEPQIAGVAHAFAESAQFADIIPTAELRLVVADDAADARALLSCVVDELQDGRLLLQTSGNVAPGSADFWDDWLDDEFERRGSTLYDCSEPGRVCLEAIYDPVLGQASVILDGALLGEGDEVAAYVLPNGSGYPTDQYGSRVVQIPRGFNNSFGRP